MLTEIRGALRHGGWEGECYGAMDKSGLVQFLMSRASYCFGVF